MVLGVQVFIINLLVCQMFALKRAQTLVDYSKPLLVELFLAFFRKHTTLTEGLFGAAGKFATVTP
jgi:hypothetical protein